MRGAAARLRVYFRFNVSVGCLKRWTKLTCRSPTECLGGVAAAGHDLERDVERGERRHEPDEQPADDDEIQRQSQRRSRGRSEQRALLQRSLEDRERMCV